MDTGLPFNPLREALYTYEELFDAFDLDDPASYARCNDVAIYRRFKMAGTHPVLEDSESTLQALHDNSISRLAASYLKQKPRRVAIMGGHDMQRGPGEYMRVVELAGALARAGVLVASGGGPGAMEAAHLGSLLKDAPQSDIDNAVAMLTSQKKLPENAGQLIDAKGNINPDIAAALHAYLAPAMRLRSVYCKGGESLALPTWLYGHEPPTPFATDIAKYFQNSIREDGLVTLGVSGIVFTEGKAGTIQEVFQDATQNYYAPDGNSFYKMVFLSSPNSAYWEEVYPVKPLIEVLLAGRPGAKGKIRFTDNLAETIEFLLS